MPHPQAIRCRKAKKALRYAVAKATQDSDIKAVLVDSLPFADTWVLIAELITGYYIAAVKLTTDMEHLVIDRRISDEKEVNEVLGRIEALFSKTMS